LAETAPDNKMRPRCNAAAGSLIGIKRPAEESGYRWSALRVARDDRGVRFRQQGLTEAHHLTRADAICKLIELGLRIAPPVLTSAHPIASDATRIEEIATHEIESCRPALPAHERERRIRHLTEGPPEFSHERIDLPKDLPKRRT